MVALRTQVVWQRLTAKKVDKLLQRKPSICRSTGCAQDQNVKCKQKVKSTFLNLANCIIHEATILMCRYEKFTRTLLLPACVPVVLMLLCRLVMHIFCRHNPTANTVQPVHPPKQKKNRFAFTCPSVRLSTCAPVRVSACLPAHLCTFPPVHLSVCLHVYLSDCAFIYSLCTPVTIIHQPTLSSQLGASKAEEWQMPLWLPLRLSNDLHRSLSICPPVYLCACSLAHMSTVPHVHLSTRPPVRLSALPSDHISALPSVRLSTWLPAHPFIRS